MSFNDWKDDALVILPNSILGRLMGGLYNRKRWLHDLLFADERMILRPTLGRWWNHRVGGLVLYGLGVRTYREIERVEREQRRRGQ